ncbi:hypothetical protein SH2C18_19890 [Clostridium sediminicola]|uniref:hypothetical protein n=1 Tax=Clostridium sediminicola TaxID=3114879 RepID=UPI0031F21E97
MAIIIYTYSNPYKINREPYWAMIKNSFHLCVSQTLVNGLSNKYKELYNGKLTTINRFINHLHNDWESDALAIKQRAIIDNLIEYMDFHEFVEDISPEDVVRSLKRNRGYVLDSVRIMIELGMEPSHIKKSVLTYEQRCVVSIYEELINTKNKAFLLKNDFTNKEIDDAIIKTINEAIQENDKNHAIDEIKKDTIVVHGIHQFSPIILRTIESLSKYKNVIILFSYQQDYKNVYQTWLNVYSWFESKIIVPAQNFNNDSQAFVGGKIADNMAAMISGSTSAIDFTEPIEIMEFDNQTEFAGYIARKFEDAENKRAQNGYIHSALFYMEEQIYSANSKVNDVLKIYFPEQFGERNFLEYPIGHFFISITNMWSPDTKSMCISDIKDVYECLTCGVIEEQYAGSLVSTLDKCKLFFSNETTLTGIIKRLKRLKRRIDDIDGDPQEKEELKRVDYYDVSVIEIDYLIKALRELNSIAEQFFIDFNNQQNDFNTFYKKISDVLKSKVLEKEDLDDEFKDIVQRVLIRLNEVEDIEASASFDCLRETMQLYLRQTPKEGKGANWIVRNFEQIDGDVLRKNHKDYEKIYHFACLSDQDMSITHRDEFPWPLDIEFFEVAQAPVDWKYQVYVTSRMEYKNFRRYALVYGLAFSKCKVKLSYIRNEIDNERELYYLLKILGGKVIPYEPDCVDGRIKNGRFINIDQPVYEQFSQYDLMKYRLCSFRFLLETVIEGGSVYKDDFLMKLYMAVILEHRARRHFSGKSYVKNIVYGYLAEEMESLALDFPFMNQLDMVDTIRVASDYIEKQAVNNGKFTKLQNKEYDYMIKRENFLYVPIGKRANEHDKEIFKNATQSEVDDVLCDDNLSKDKYYKRLNTLCEKCTEKDICLEVFKIKKN